MERTLTRALEDLAAHIAHKQSRERFYRGTEADCPLCQLVGRECGSCPCNEYWKANYGKGMARRACADMMVEAGGVTRVKEETALGSPTRLDIPFGTAWTAYGRLVQFLKDREAKRHG